MKGKRICDWICLVLWCVQAIMAIIKWVIGATVHPSVFLCPVLICIMHYVDELVRDYYGKI